jgi:hypothetical protein
MITLKHAAGIVAAALSVAAVMQYGITTHARNAALRRNVAFAKRLSMRHWLEVSQQVTRLRRCRIPTMMLSADF